MQKVRNLDNSPWSLLAEREGLWGLDAVCSIARTRTVREMFMLNMENRQQQQLEDEPKAIGTTIDDEDDLLDWRNSDDERLAHSDTDEERETEDDYGEDPLRVLRDLNQTLEESNELDLSNSLAASTYSMTAAKQELDLTASRDFTSSPSAFGADTRLSQSFAGSSHLTMVDRQASPLLEDKTKRSSRRIMSTQTNGSPSADSFLNGGSEELEHQLVTISRFTDPSAKGKGEDSLVDFFSLV